MKGWVGVDLDGTLAYYDQWRGVEHIGKPIPAMVERVKALLRARVDVRIFTARVSGLDAADARGYIEVWCEGVFGKALPVTCIKDMAMTTMYDDRARQVELNTGRVIGE